jgi:hypothetical protein
VATGLDTIADTGACSVRSGSPWAKAIGKGVKYFPTRIPPQHNIPNPRLEERGRIIQVLMTRHWLAAKWREFQGKQRGLRFLRFFLNIEKNGKTPAVATRWTRTPQAISGAGASMPNHSALPSFPPARPL